MDKSQQQVRQHLQEAQASELTLVRVLQSQIAMTPRGRMREVLEAHLHETRNHAQRVRGRLSELGHGANPLRSALGAAQSAAGQLLALAKSPIDLLRGRGGEEKVLKNAKDACATEALEIATYTTIEHLARAVDDRTTAELATSIRGDEEQMLTRLLDELPRLSEAVVRSQVRGPGSHDAARTGTADAAREAGQRARGTAPADGAQPWSGYDEQTAAQVRETLADADARQRGPCPTTSAHTRTAPASCGPPSGSSHRPSRSPPREGAPPPSWWGRRACAGANIRSVRGSRHHAGREQCRSTAERFLPVPLPRPCGRLHPAAGAAAGGGGRRRPPVASALVRGGLTARGAAHGGPAGARARHGRARRHGPSEPPAHRSPAQGQSPEAQSLSAARVAATMAASCPGGCRARRSRNPPRASAACRVPPARWRCAR